MKTDNAFCPFGRGRGGRLTDRSTRGGLCRSHIGRCGRGSRCLGLGESEIGETADGQCVRQDDARPSCSLCSAGHEAQVSRLFPLAETDGNIRRARWCRREDEVAVERANALARDCGKSRSEHSFSRTYARRYSLSLNSPCTLAKMTVSPSLPGASGARKLGMVQESQMNLAESSSGCFVFGS